MKVIKCNNPLGPNIMRRHANIAWQMWSNNSVSRCPIVNIWLIVSCESEHPHISLISWERLFKQSTVGHNWWLRLLPWILIRDVLFVLAINTEIAEIFVRSQSDHSGQQYGRYQRLLFTRQDFCKIWVCPWKDSLVTFCLLLSPWCKKIYGEKDKKTDFDRNLNQF